MTFKPFTLLPGHALLIDVDLHPSSPTYGTAPVSLISHHSTVQRSPIGFHRVSSDELSQLDILKTFYPSCRVRDSAIARMGSLGNYMGLRAFQWQKDLIEQCLYHAGRGIIEMEDAHRRARSLADFDPSQPPIQDLEDHPLWLELTATFHQLMSRRLIIDCLGLVFNQHSAFVHAKNRGTRHNMETSSSPELKIDEYYHWILRDPWTLAQSMTAAKKHLENAQEYARCADAFGIAMQSSLAIVRLCPYWPVLWFCAPFEARLAGTEEGNEIGVAGLLVNAWFKLVEAQHAAALYDQANLVLLEMQRWPWISNSELADILKLYKWGIEMTRIRDELDARKRGISLKTETAEEARAWEERIADIESRPANDPVNDFEGFSLEHVKATCSGLEGKFKRGKKDVDWPVEVDEEERERLDAWRDRIKKDCIAFMKEVGW